MNITYRKTKSGQWLVCEAKPHTYGIGTKKVGTPTGAHTTGHQYAKFNTEPEAIAFMQTMSVRFGMEIVEWIEPVERNQQYIDLDKPDDTRITINADKTIEWYRGEVLKNVDITEGKWFGYDFAIVDMTSFTRLLLSDNGSYRVGDLKKIILVFRTLVDIRLGGTDE